MIALEGDGYVMISAVDGALGWDRLYPLIPVTVSLAGIGSIR
jgi:hypothetical protein